MYRFLLAPRWIAFHLLVVVGVVAMVNLGFWQLRRMDERQAFNAIDTRAGGVWSLNGTTVVIDWISGWRTTMSLDPATPLQLRHWAPGADRNGPETGGVRQGKRLE